MSLLHVDDLHIHFRTHRGNIRAVHGLSFELERGETLGIVGESGSGKSVTALAILGLLPPPAHIANGSIRFEGRDLLRCSDRELRTLRGNRVAMIFKIR